MFDATELAMPVRQEVPQAPAFAAKRGMDAVSRWLLITRACVFSMTLTSGLIGGLSWAEGLVELPDGAVTVKPGDPVRYLPYGSFGLGA